MKSEFSPEELERLYSNPTISKKHTKVSYEVSKRAHHTKTISSTKFKSNLPKLLNILGFQA